KWSRYRSDFTSATAEKHYNTAMDLGSDSRDPITYFSVIFGSDNIREFKKFSAELQIEVLKLCARDVIVILGKEKLNRKCLSNFGLPYPDNID
ncbi:hypothetical protein OFL77_26905, partial [Escherichia coli]|uniref:hypothetical protein n=1 Tax=Escherichia coli TaxID=562 RepID=UPI0021E04E5F